MCRQEQLSCLWFDLTRKADRGRGLRPQTFARRAASLEVGIGLETYRIRNGRRGEGSRLRSLPL